jgi:hypothetical protein
LAFFLVADEVVIDDEGRMKSSLPEIVEFTDQLFRLLHPRLAAVDDDDVAKLALERAAPRILQGRRGVAADLQLVEPRPGHLRHVGRRRLLVPRIGLQVVGKLVEKTGPGGLCFPHETHVAESLEKLLLHRHQRATDHREDVGLAEPHQNLPHPFLLDDHSRHADDVVARERRPVDLLDVLIDERHVMLAAESGERRERARDHRAPLVAGIERERKVEPPVRRFKARVDQADRELSTRPLRGGRVGCTSVAVAGDARSSTPTAPSTEQASSMMDRVALILEFPSFSNVFDMDRDYRRRGRLPVCRNSPRIGGRRKTPKAKMQPSPRGCPQAAISAGFRRQSVGGSSGGSSQVSTSTTATM